MNLLNLTSEEKLKLMNSMTDLQIMNIDLSNNLYKIFLKNDEIALLFKHVPIETQKKMFKMSFESILFFMDNPNQMKIELQDMGKKHKRYGVKKYHVPIFKASLLEAIKNSFSYETTNEMLKVWEKAIDIIVDSLGQNLV